VNDSSGSLVSPVLEAGSKSTIVAAGAKSATAVESLDGSALAAGVCTACR